MNPLPCVVTRDLHRYLAALEAGERETARLEALSEARYQWLTEDAAGIGEVLEALYSDAGRTIEAAVFGLFAAWRQGHDLRPTATALAALLEHHARRLAECWAEEQTAREDQEAALDGWDTEDR